MIDIEAPSDALRYSLEEHCIGGPTNGRIPPTNENRLMDVRATLGAKRRDLFKDNWRIVVS